MEDGEELEAVKAAFRSIRLELRWNRDEATGRMWIGTTRARSPLDAASQAARETRRCVRARSECGHSRALAILENALSGPGLLVVIEKSARLSPGV